MTHYHTTGCPSDNILNSNLY